MNFLKQTALVLGLVSLSLGGWALFKNWRQKLAILYAILCFTVAGWALSFVSHATLGGRLSKDIHWGFNVWLAPIGVLIVSKILSNADAFGKWLFRISFAGAIPLSLAIALSVHELTSQDWFWMTVSFWPTFVLLEYIHVMVADLICRRPVDIDFISATKRKWLYAGLGVSLAICSFDHIPWPEYFVPAIGNLAFAAYLAFASQTLSPQRLLGLEAMVSRFFAVVILSLVITGYFALLYQYMSETFGLFLLNSFLISLSVLVLWNPLIAFFRFLAQRLLRSESETRKQWLERFRLGLGGVTSQVELGNLLEAFFLQTLQSRKISSEFDLQGLRLPEPVRDFFVTLKVRRETPLLHRVLVQLERDQVLTQERRQELDHLIQYLDHNQCDLVFPVFGDVAESGPIRIVGLVRVALPTSIDEWTVSLGFYAQVASTLQILAPTLQRIQQVESALEKDRLALMGEMAAGLAHEIRNPLGAIKGASELLLRPDGQVEGRWARVIHEEVDRLNRLVSQFLDFSHTSPDVPDNVNLLDLVERAMATLRPALKNASVIEVVPPPEKVQALVVPDQVQQVLLNLIQNAIKATDPASGATREPRIQVQVFKTGFLVQDNGVGMSPETAERVFQPFFSSFRTGSGLGLSICQRLVAANDGSIQIQSRLGEGTTVKVNLCETRSS